MVESTLNTALRQFEVVEANLVKAERLLDTIMEAIPNSVAFGGNSDYESNCFYFDAVYASLPKIKGWKPEIRLLELDEIAQNRLDARELGEIECIVHVEQSIDEPSKSLRQYRLRFAQMRRSLVREALEKLIVGVDECIEVLSQTHESRVEVYEENLRVLEQNLAQINVLIGSDTANPGHLSVVRDILFGLNNADLETAQRCWPQATADLRKWVYSDNDPIDVDIADLENVVNSKPKGGVATKLNWSNLSAEEFERLIYALVAMAPGYENAAWLMKTNAPDRGRDVSVFRVHSDALSGTMRRRVIIQCKHWMTKSVGMAEIAILREQMKLWESPRVDVHVIATTGRFTSDAISAVENQNLSDSALRIEMWPESHLELLLASRPDLIAEFGLR